MKGNYYIIAFNNNLRIISLNNDMLRESDVSKLSNLAYLDLLTSNIEESKFRKYLLDNKIIDKIYTPIFIVKKYKYNGKYNIKFHNLIFKDNNSYLINNLALTDLRNRYISLRDCGYLLKKFGMEYCRDNKFKNIIDNIINSHEVDDLLNYQENKDKMDQRFRYSLLRDIVSSMQISDKYDSVYDYIMDTYKKVDYVDDIVTAINSFEYNLPNNYKKFISNNIGQRVLKEEELKITPWDNKKAQKHYQEGRFVDWEIQTLTLEDEYRYGFIDYSKYLRLNKRFKRK